MLGLRQGRCQVRTDILLALPNLFGCRWQRLGRRVETTTGEPYAYVAPRTITVSSSALPAGTTSTVQSAGASGFTVQYTRKVFEGPKLVKDERYTVRYDAQNAIVEVGTKKKPKPPPKAAAEPETPPRASPGDTTASPPDEAP